MGSGKETKDASSRSRFVSHACIGPIRTCLTERKRRGVDDKREREGGSGGPCRMSYIISTVMMITNEWSVLIGKLLSKMFIRTSSKICSKSLWTNDSVTMPNRLEKMSIG